MSVFQILHYPDHRLRKVAAKVSEFNAEIRCIINDMFETMYFKNGIGLAATQIDIHKRIVVIDISEKKIHQLVLINPIIFEKWGSTAIEEGCLSVPEHRSFIPRAEWISLRAQNKEGESFELKTNGLLSICIQHEIDHLNGKLFIDYLSPLKKNRIKQKLEKLYRQNLRSS